MLTDCPECNGPSEVVRTYYVKDVACAELYCVYGHRFAATLEWLLDKTFAMDEIPHSGLVVFYYAAAGDDSIGQWLKETRPEDN